MNENIIIPESEIQETINIDTPIKEYHITWDVFEKLYPLVNGEHKNEFSGAFHESIDVECCSKEFVCLPSVKITRGKGDSARFFDTIPFTYHTHPKYYYTAYHVKIAPPSGEDIGVFLRGCVESKTCVHIVLSLEGLYIMYANPCFIRQARRLYKRGKTNEYARAAYNIALVGAEILGMVTHEYRSIWTTEEWLQWIRSRFVCKNVPTQEYSSEIKQKFKYHCDDCSDVYIKKFQNLFNKIVRTSFKLAKCSAENTIHQTRWKEGNWIDVDFISWEKAKTDGFVRIRCC